MEDSTPKKVPWYAYAASLGRTAMKQWWFGFGVAILTVALVINQGWLPEGTLSRLAASATAFVGALNPFGG